MREGGLGKLQNRGVKIPPKGECLDLMKRYNGMGNIIQHCIKVAEIALSISTALNRRGENLNLNVVEAAALLHDITKTRSFKTGENHADTGSRLLESMGYKEVGDIVRQHVRLDTYSVSDSITEVEIVNYADKRVLHDQVVGLKERKAYIFEKYGKSPENKNRLIGLWKETEKLENRIFQNLPFDPEQLPDYFTTPQALAE